jgi:hypothetical protein
MMIDPKRRVRGSRSQISGKILIGPEFIDGRKAQASMDLP